MSDKQPRRVPRPVRTVSQLQSLPELPKTRHSRSGTIDEKGRMESMSHRIKRVRRIISITETLDKRLSLASGNIYGERSAIVAEALENWLADWEGRKQTQDQILKSEEKT